jgi:ATP-dependent DNA ligase
MNCQTHLEARAHFALVGDTAAGLADSVQIELRTRRQLTPSTTDRALAAGWLERFQGAGIDGVIAKPGRLRYQPGARAMIKVKAERTADCVVAGMRPTLDRPGVASLLLGLYDEEGGLRHVGVVSSLSGERRRELFDELAPLAIPLERHPWQRGFAMPPGSGSTGRLHGAAGRWDPERMEVDWIPLAPERVLEVAYDQVDACRMRHPGRFRRWRPDRDPRSCLLDQLEPAAVDPGRVLA